MTRFYIMASYVAGEYGTLKIVSDVPIGNKILTSDGWSDKQAFDEALVALANGAGTADVAVGTTWEPMQAGTLTIGGNGWVDNGSVNNNEVKYTGTVSGINHWMFVCKVNFSAVVAAKELMFMMALNGIEMVCSDVVFETRGLGKIQTATLTGCGIIAVDDVVSIHYESDDGAVCTIEKVRWMATQAR